jgi:2-succinyl-5-enolpyruvyl-6-hydroxy-3-cyclohexene-1-carboxylate synthase
VKVFTDARMTDKPILFEVFTDTEDENAALKAMHTIESDATGTAKKLAKEVLGDKGFQALKNLIKK